MVFFALSAYLFGMKWCQNEYDVFDFRGFLKKRCLRIYIPLWLTLPLIIAVEYLIKHFVDIKTLLFNIVGLGWAKPFGVAGHLWYITLMMFLYFAFVLFSRIRLDKFRLIYWLLGYVVLLAAYVLGESHFVTFSSVAPVITVFLAGLLFFKGDELLEYCSRKSEVVLLVTIIALALSWYMYAIGWHNTHKAVATFSSFSAGFGLFVCLLTLVKPSHNSRFVTHFADISYEVYLVHVPLLHLLKMIGFENYWGVVIISWLVLTYVCAIGVHKTTQRIILDLNKK